VTVEWRNSEKKGRGDTNFILHQLFYHNLNKGSTEDKAGEEDVQ